MKGSFITLFCVSFILNIGLVTGFVHIDTPKGNAETAYFDEQREQMAALVESVE